MSNNYVFDWQAQAVMARSWPGNCHEVSGASLNAQTFYCVLTWKLLLPAPWHYLRPRQQQLAALLLATHAVADSRCFQPLTRTFRLLLANPA